MLSRVLKAGLSDVVIFTWARKDDLGHPVNPSESHAKPPAMAMPVQKEDLDAELSLRVRQAHAAGFREGEAAGARKTQAEEHAVLQRLAAAVDEVAGLRHEVLGRAGEDTVRLSVEIARRILHRELTVDPAALEALVRAALDKLRSREIYRVRVHPGQEQILRKCLKERDPDSAIEVVGDPLRARGEAVFETRFGSLDASVETQLREIERGLTDQLGERA